MSDTPANTPKPAIVAAKTPNDLIYALDADPALLQTVLGAFADLIQSKAALHSKTLWVALLTPIISAGFAHYGVTPAAEVPLDIAGVVFGIVMAVMRLITTGGPVVSVLPEAGATTTGGTV